VFKKFPIVTLCFLHLLTQTAWAVDFSPAIPVIPIPAAGIPTTEFSYNSFGQVTQTVDPNGVMLPLKQGEFK